MTFVPVGQGLAVRGTGTLARPSKPLPLTRGDSSSICGKPSGLPSNPQSSRMGEKFISLNVRAPPFAPTLRYCASKQAAEYTRQQSAQWLIKFVRNLLLGGQWEQGVNSRGGAYQLPTTRFHPARANLGMKNISVSFSRPHRQRAISSM